MWSIHQVYVVAILVGSIATAVAQAPAETTVERSIKALPNRDTQIGVYMNV